MAMTTAGNGIAKTFVTLPLLPLLLVLLSTVFQHLCFVCLRAMLACLDHWQACAQRHPLRKNRAALICARGCSLENPPALYNPALHAELKMVMPTVVAK